MFLLSLPLPVGRLHFSPFLSHHSSDCPGGFQVVTTGLGLLYPCSKASSFIDWEGSWYWHTPLDYPAFKCVSQSSKSPLRVTTCYRFCFSKESRLAHLPQPAARCKDWAQGRKTHFKLRVSGGKWSHNRVVLPLHPGHRATGKADRTGALWAHCFDWERRLCLVAAPWWRAKLCQPQLRYHLPAGDLQGQGPCNMFTSCVAISNILQLR